MSAESMSALTTSEDGPCDNTHSSTKEPVYLKKKKELYRKIVTVHS